LPADTGAMASYRKGRLSRFLKLGGLTSKVSASYLGQKIKSAFVSAEAMQQSLVAANIRNAERIVKTLGELKGSVMKLGQMLSLQADVLPREMTEILSRLQREAPAVGFDVMRQQMERELDRPLEQAFAELDEQAYASASIGQVHRGRLHDGREVVVKVQYPGVDRMVESDLRNARTLFKLATHARNIVNLDAVFDEVNARMAEEVDYCNEKLNMLLFAELFAEDERVIVPRPIDELTTRRVLTMEIVRGISADELCRPEVPQARRDRVGETLVDILLRQIFELRVLHADPNLANFAFTDDDQVILYDFGCVKRLPAPFIAAYRQLVLDGLAGRVERLSDDLAAIGFADPKGKRVEDKILRQYLEPLVEPWQGGPYCFATSTIHRRLIAVGLKNWTHFAGFTIPADIIFLDRVVGGMYGNLRKLGSTADWGALLRSHLG
jgi:predicted unusual protein kinase regulating ubiquinone biosynthesis (AarF/ABC1/UbiB family)